MAQRMIVVEKCKPYLACKLQLNQADQRSYVKIKLDNE